MSLVMLVYLVLVLIMEELVKVKCHSLSSNHLVAN